MRARHAPRASKGAARVSCRVQGAARRVLRKGTDRTVRVTHEVGARSVCLCNFPGIRKTKLDKIALGFLTSARHVAECESRCRRPAASTRRKPVTGESEQGACARCPGDAWRVGDAANCTHSRFTRGSTRRPAASKALHELRSGSRTMRIELHSSNRNEWPLGTGRSPMHGRALTELRRRTTHGPRGTAQGNRGSAAQGGIRANPGFLPFLTSTIAVGALAPAGLVLGAAEAARPHASAPVLELSPAGRCVEAHRPVSKPSLRSLA